MLPRLLDLASTKRSFFLLGPRQVGKTSLIRNTLNPHLIIDLAPQSEYLRYAKNPALLEKEISALSSEKLCIVIDEIQRLPDLLNTVQHILDQDQDASRPVQFVMTGSSARKLRRKGSNLLGGRALNFRLHPFTHLELGDAFSLEKALHYGTLPSVALEPQDTEKIRLLKSYAEIYLREEIQQEALTRNVPAFARFLELAAFENGRLLNFTNIAREVGVESKTIKEYFQILDDTLLGFFLHPTARSHRERIIAHSRFYFFDTGVTRALKGQAATLLIEGTPDFGDAFEHWVILETRRLLDYRERETKMSFFRTSDGAEVDLLLEFPKEIWAIEVKSNPSPSRADLRGLRSFLKDHNAAKAFCVCRTPRPYREGRIDFVPWKDFFGMI